MSHDEDVRLVDYLRKRLVQAADRDHVDYAIDARHADHEAIAAVIALVQEHEAIAQLKAFGDDPDLATPVAMGILSAALEAAHDNAERVLATSRQQSHDVMTTSDREEQT